MTKEDTIAAIEYELALTKTLYDKIKGHPLMANPILERIKELEEELKTTEKKMINITSEKIQKWLLLQKWKRVHVLETAGLLVFEHEYKYFRITITEDTNHSFFEAMCECVLIAISTIAGLSYYEIQRQISRI